LVWVGAQHRQVEVRHDGMTALKVQREQAALDERR